MEDGRRRRKREEPAESDEPSAFEAEPAPERPKKKRRRPKPDEKPKEAPPPWAAWIDPAGLMWVPILAPLLAFAVGSAIFSTAIPEVGAEGPPIKIGELFLIFSGIVAVVPLTYVLQQWTQVSVTWAQGGRRDPPWPDFDGGAVLVQLLRSTVAAGFSAAVVAPLFFLKLSGPAAIATSTVAAIAAAGYFLFALLAMGLFDSVTAANPLAILLGVLRMRQGLLSFAFELAVYVLGTIGWFTLIQKLWMKNMWDVGILCWGLWWAMAILAGARMMRVAGMTYEKNAKRVGWFG